MSFSVWSPFCLPFPLIVIWLTIGCSADDSNCVVAEDAAPDTAADYVVTYSASADAPRKVLLNNAAAGGADESLIFLLT